MKVYVIEQMDTNWILRGSIDPPETYPEAYTTEEQAQRRIDELKRIISGQNWSFRLHVIDLHGDLPNEQICRENLRARELKETLKEVKTFVTEAYRSLSMGRIQALQAWQRVDEGLQGD